MSILLTGSHGLYRVYIGIYQNFFPLVVAVPCMHAVHMCVLLTLIKLHGSLIFCLRYYYG